MTIFRKYIVTLLLLTFVGQATSFVDVDCESQSSPMQSHEQAMDSGVMVHSQHMASDSPFDDGIASGDCCPDCECGMSGCSSAVLPVSQSAFSSSLTQLSSVYSESIDNQVRITPFRPPISR